MSGNNPDNRICMEVQDRVNVMLSEIDQALPGLWNFDDFRAWLSERRGVPLEIRTVPGGMDPDSPCGWTIVCEDRDIIYSSNAVRQGRVVSYHECAHLLFDHSSSGEDRQLLGECLAPDVDPELIKKILGRTDYDRPQEQEAELLAMRLWRRDVEYFGIRSTNRQVATRVGRARLLLRGGR
ncbi:hypothetical protein [Rhodococcus zopfii]|uniref:hypothetical protein n=1 Tax=Rhodococcus zopfii TaxID=43772 RepID=UPI000B07B2C1|nr:hypothetical protein [Rhodococcus zopfii]